MIKVKIIFIIIVFELVTSCKTSVLISQSTADNQITIDSTQCGSYEVKSNETTIGYVVKPFVVEVDRLKEITEFERKLRVKYKNKFNRDYRTYAFTTDRAKDTILITLFLSSKQGENIPGWKCELQDVSTYPKRSEWVYYNCSKNRFKVPSDPD